MENSSRVSSISQQSISLARKYRPQTFEDLLGQNIVRQALTNAIKMERPPSAVIFSGTRGIGKTTLARLYAKSLCCEQGPTPKPCGTCEACLAIEHGRHEDVVEIDGASHNGVEEIREILESCQYLPQRAQFKIYIIDEVHMLSQSAFNALLKTLEEPPSGVIFIFATTELHRMPETVQGRCQTFHLKKISFVDLQQRIEYILRHEGLAFQPEILPIVAQQGRGSLRDALSFLDQVVAVSAGDLTLSALQAITKTFGLDDYVSLIKNLLDQDLQSALQWIYKADELGLDPGDVLADVISSLRDLQIARQVQEQVAKQLTGLSVEKINQLKHNFVNVHPTMTQKLLKMLVDCRRNFDGSIMDRYLFENVCMEFCIVPVEGVIKTEPPKGMGQSLDPRLRGDDMRRGDDDVGRGDETRRGDDVGRVEDTPRREIEVPQQITVKQPATQNPWPLTWENLLSDWEKQEPFQAKKLEELYPMHYEKDKIILGVPENSLVSQFISKSETNVLEDLKKIFGFKGVLQFVICKEKPTDEISESILEKKEKARDVAKKQIIDQANQHPLAQGLLSKYGGTLTHLNENGH